MKNTLPMDLHRIKQKIWEYENASLLCETDVKIRLQ